MSPSQTLPHPTSCFKNRQIHFREDLLFLLVAAWQPVLTFLAAWLGCHSMWERGDVQGDVFGHCPFPRFHTHLLFTSSRHVLKQCCFEPVRANHRWRWAECGTVGCTATAQSNGGQRLAQSKKNKQKKKQDDIESNGETTKSSSFLFC